MDLGEFLLARIAEDETEAKRQNSDFLRNHGPGALLEELKGYGFHWLVSSVTTASHVLAECEAKRRLIEIDARQAKDKGILAALALPYADHPDFRPEWSALADA